ncbi:MAG: hypothetical protein QXO76_09805 [Thermoproteota archaeon]
MIAGGKATKRSRYGFTIDDQAKGTVNASRTVMEAGLKVHVIDSEWKANDVSPSEVEVLLGLFPSIRTYITLAARRRDVEQLVRLYLPMLEDAGNSGICIVAGNKVYLEGEELSTDPCSSILKVLKLVYGRVSKIMLGVEGVESRIVNIISTYPDVELFYLYDEMKVETIAEHAKSGVRTAVYVPYAIDRSPNDVVKALSDYALRRKWLREEIRGMGYQASQALKFSNAPAELSKVISKAVSRLSIYGSKNEVVEKLRRLRDCGVSTIVGLPVFESPDQVHAFSECLKSV